MPISQLVLVSRETRTVLSASFLKNSKLRSERYNREQIRAFLDEQRQMIIAEYCEKIGHHELQAVRAEEERRILREELWRQQKDFREVHQQSGGITKIPKFYHRYARKTQAHRGSEHYYGIIRESTRTTKMN